MASGAFTPPSPPGSQQGPDAGGPLASPTSPPGASPSPATPSPGVDTASQSIIQIVKLTRGLAQQYPEAAQLVAEINDKLRQILPIVMGKQRMAEPPAPPM